ncbi:MAG: hypothetical protein DDT32_00604 [Syntrophomonadaceae bacterium]|nr:hypothetical protein [Bacillota bacterium]MBT9146857.1 hypothetical protein [Bacillota bacterium]
MSEEVSAVIRRLPVYLLLDCSGSMSGEPIEAVRMGLRSLVSDLQGDPQALETVWLSIITFDSSAKQVVSLTEVGSFQEPVLNASGTTALGEALKLLLNSVDKEVRKTTTKQKGDYKPLIFLMTDGMPTDSWENAADEVMRRKFGNIIACAVGPGAEDAVLKRITNTVIRLQDVSPGTLGAFMGWMTASISETGASVSARGDAPIDLPPPPKDAGIVIVP